MIPTKDEQDIMATIIQGCKNALQGIDHEIIAVDASNDNTPSEVVRAGAKLVKQIGSGGVGEAMTQGFYWASGEYIVFLDGDGTYDPADLPKLIEPLLNNEADLVNGNRFANMEKGAMTFTNKIGNRLNMGGELNVSYKY
jgi:glycosyltransferase involved in cell wall biosynthesis